MWRTGKECDGKCFWVHAWYFQKSFAQSRELLKKHFLCWGYWYKTSVCLLVRKWIFWENDVLHFAMITARPWLKYFAARSMCWKTILLYNLSKKKPVAIKTSSSKRKGRRAESRANWSRIVLQIKLCESEFEQSQLPTAKKLFSLVLQLLFKFVHSMRPNRKQKSFSDLFLLVFLLQSV